LKTLFQEKIWNFFFIYSYGLKFYLTFFFIKQPSGWKSTFLKWISCVHGLKYDPCIYYIYNVSIFLDFKTTSHVFIYVNQLCYAKCISSYAILNHGITPSFKINIVFKVEVKAMLSGDSSIYPSCFQVN